MLISYSHRFLFIHVGKTGGMSMREVLKQYSQEPEKFRIRRPARMNGERPNPLYTVWETLLLHAKARDVQQEIPPEIYNDFFKFAFVRNPWDLMVSMYHFILRDPAVPRHGQVKAAGSFDGFVDWVGATSDPFPKGITRLQSEMLTDGQGNLLVDFIGHYEQLDEDFAHVATRVGIADRLPHLNRSQHKDYRTYYSDRSRDLVGEYFKTDIDLFGYTFDGLRAPVEAGR
jgi:hypothetical protein